MRRKPGQTAHAQAMRFLNQKLGSDWRTRSYSVEDCIEVLTEHQFPSHKARNRAFMLVRQRAGENTWKASKVILALKQGSA